MKKLLSILSLGLVLAVACNKDPKETPRTLSEFSVKPDVATVSEGDNFKLKVTATPVYDDMELTFKSSNEAVATVDAKGTVNAVAAGEAVITISNNIDKKTAECKVTVSETITLKNLVVDPVDLELSVGQTVKVNVTPEPALPDLEYTWTSNNPEICTVDNEGNVTAVAEGNTVVMVTEKTYDKSATVNVKVSLRLFSGGKGTTSEPYQIASQEDLKLLAEYSLGGENVAQYAFETASYIVTKDITFTPFNEAGDTVNVLGTPWGTSEKPFKGIFDGNNKKISGLFMGNYFKALDPAFSPTFDNNTCINYATGLIGFAEGATIKNVILENPHIQSTGVNVGGIVGAARANTQIFNCKVIGGVPSDCYDGGKLVNYGDVSVTTKGGAYIYGKGKYLSAKDNSAPFGADGYQFSYGFVGGIAGQIKDSKIDECSVNAYVRCAQRNVGGIAGIIIGDAQVINCTAEGLVSTKMTNSGGLVGTMLGASTVIEGCTVKNVFMSKYSYGGCITGMCCEGGMIRNCVADGASVCLYNPDAGANFAGGIIGYIKAKPVIIEDCKVVNTSVSATGYGIAGILGRNDCSVTISNCYVGNCNLEGLRTYEGWSTYVGKDAKGGYWVAGIVGQVNTGALSNSVAQIDNCYVETDIKASYGAAGIFATSTTKNDGTTPIYVSNVAYKGKITTWSMNSYNHAMCGGIAGNPNSTTKGSTLHIVNCYAFPEIELSSVATAGSTAGLLGYSQNNVQLLNGYSNITRDQILKNTDGALAPIPENQNRYGGILGVTNCNSAGSNGDQFIYKSLYYSDQIQFGVSNTKDGSGAYVFDCEQCEALAKAAFTDGTLLAKLNAAVAAYNADPNKKATASAWVAGTDGFPTISGLPTGK